MPNKDGTGPMGEGPRTGRGLGDCQIDTKDKTIVTKPAPRLGRGGRGRGLGLGRRNIDATT